MANIAFDFLAGSFLFDNRYIEENYRTQTENELVSELIRYREHIEKHFDEIILEVRNDTELNVSIETLDSLPDEQLLKQLAMYLDKVVISDPIFEISLAVDNAQLDFGKLLNLKRERSIDRKQLADAAKYMKWSAPLVARQFIKYAPTASLHEAPKEIPLTYSEDGYSSMLSQDLYQFFYNKVNVRNIQVTDGEMVISPDKKLHPGTAIAIDFDPEQARPSHMFQYMTAEVHDFDEKTGKFAIQTYVPDTINESDFRVWVNKSINQAAIEEFERTFNEVMFAEKMKCRYLAKTSFTAELLQQSIAKKNIETDLANLSMNLELPFIHNIALSDLISIRYDNGESFHNFRNALNSKLLELRGIDDKDTLAAKLESISYELSTINVAEVNKEYRKILRSLGADAVLLTGSLLTNYFTGGLTLIGAAGAIVKGSADYIKYLNEVKENNGYFIWNLSKKGLLHA